MTVKNITLLSMAGTGLVASNSVFITSSSASKSSTKQKENVNAYDPENQSITTNKSQTKDYIKKEINNNIYIHQDIEPKRYYLSKSSFSLPDFFTLPFFASSDDYAGFLKSEIKIKLFKNPVWRSATKSDEYELNPLSTEQVEDLFKDSDELKVKQLLLSLLTRKQWETYSSSISDFWAGHDIIKPSALKDLKDLKIKYFKDFDGLKKYIQDKVKVCTTEKRICVAQKKELTIIDQDELEFFDESNLPKS